jgi:hypothetical protein
MRRTSLSTIRGGSRRMGGRRELDGGLGSDGGSGGGGSGGGREPPTDRGRLLYSPVTLMLSLVTPGMSAFTSKLLSFSTCGRAGRWERGGGGEGGGEGAVEVRGRWASGAGRRVRGRAAKEANQRRDERICVQGKGCSTIQRPGRGRRRHWWRARRALPPCSTARHQTQAPRYRQSSRDLTTP